MTAETIFKVLTPRQWSDFQAGGVFTGAPVDTADGFIHFSSREQVVETVAKHFAGQGDLYLLEVRSEPLGDKLRWEASRGGDLFPHLYDTLPIEAVESTAQLPWDGEKHCFPDDIPST